MQDRRMPVVLDFAARSLMIRSAKQGDVGKDKMGIISKLKGELVDIIEWFDDSRSTLAWRFPRYENEIKNGAELIVREGQRAVFVYRGQLADQFGPGHY